MSKKTPQSRATKRVSPGTPGNTARNRPKNPGSRAPRVRFFRAGAPGDTTKPKDPHKSTVSAKAVAAQFKEDAKETELSAVADLALCDPKRTSSGNTIAWHVLRELKPRWITGFLPSWVFVGDARYYCPTREEAQAIVHRARVTAEKYIPERYDCDDFAFAMKAEVARLQRKELKFPGPIAFGIVWKDKPSSHAMNWILVREGTDARATTKLYLVEPQNAEIEAPRKDDSDVYLAIV